MTAPMNPSVDRIGSEWRDGLLEAVVGALVLGALSAAGDWVWWRFIPDGAVVPGVVHGLIVFLVIAAVLSWSIQRGDDGTTGAARGRSLLWQLPIVGALLAASFYPLYFVLGYLGALLATWAGMWLVIAALQRRARGSVESRGRTIGRGVLAAVGSGLAFWAISGIWTAPSPDGPNLVTHFASWSFAFFPGFAALLVGHRHESSDDLSRQP